jgi:hypothetical protein
MGEQAAEGDITPMSDVIGRDYPERGQLGGLEWSRPRNWIAAAQQQRRLRRSSAPSLLEGYRSLAGWGSCDLMGRPAMSHKNGRCRAAEVINSSTSSLSSKGQLSTGCDASLRRILK